MQIYVKKLNKESLDKYFFEIERADFATLFSKIGSRLFTNLSRINFWLVLSLTYEVSDRKPSTNFLISYRNTDY